MQGRAVFGNEELEPGALLLGELVIFSLVWNFTILKMEQVSIKESCWKMCPGLYPENPFWEKNEKLVNKH